MKKILLSLRLPLWCIALLISGCATAPGVGDLSTKTAGPAMESWQISDADRLIARAQQAPTPVAANRNYLEAAQIYLALGELSKADATYALLDRESLDSTLYFNYQLFHVEWLMDSTRLNKAWQESLQIQPHNRIERNQLLLIKARIAEGLGSYRDAATALMSVHAETSEQQALNDKIWQYVNLTPVNEIQENQSSSQAREEKAWWRLALALQEGFDPAEQRHILRNWITMHPDHPAALQLPSSLIQLLSTPERHRRIALMLPLSGPLGSAGKVVRDGFIAGYLHRSEIDSAKASRPPLQIFDTYGRSMASLYEEATLANVELIVGPLSKAKVADLGRLSNRQIPVLALNYLAENTETPPNFFQLGLAIEDEARALVERLQQEGIGQIALIHGSDSWALRGAQAFEDYWQSSNPGNLAQEDFEDPRKITQTVGDLFAVTDSMARHEHLDRIIRSNSEMVPRSRQDIQALVALVDSDQMRALKPALAFHFVKSTPIYASSQVLQDISPGQYSQLEGVRLSEIPWLVYDSEIQRNIESAFPDYNNRVAPLYALGVDAYRLVARIDLLTESADDRILGGTGTLRLGANGRIGRELIWATIRNGKLESLPGISTPSL